MKIENELRANAIQSALIKGEFASCPYKGIKGEFIWDWQQDGYIELISGDNVEEIKNLPHCCFCHIEDFVTNDNDEVIQDGYVIKIESVHIYKNHVLSICCKDGIVLSHRAWRHIDWEKCGF